MSSVHFSISQIASTHNVLNEKETDRLLELYRNYHNKENSTDDFTLGFDSAEACRYPWKNFDVSLPIKTIEKTAKDSGIIQLRPVAKERVLVVGCGHQPLVDTAGYSFDSEEEAREYHAQHTHDGAITINPSLACNPTIAAYFGRHRFPMLEDGQFDLIVMESTGPSDTEIGREELTRLISKKGLIVTEYGDQKGRLFSWEKEKEDPWQKGFVMPEPIIDLSNHPSFFTKKQKQPYCSVQ